MSYIRQADGTVVDKTAAEVIPASSPDIKLQKFTFDKIEGGIYKLRFIQDEQPFFETDAFIIEPAVLIHTLFFTNSMFMLAPVDTSNTTYIKQILVRNNQIINGSQNGITIASPLCRKFDHRWKHDRRLSTFCHNSFIDKRTYR